MPIIEMWGERSVRHDGMPGGRWTRTIPLLQAVVGTLADLFTPGTLSGMPLLASAPLVAAVLYPYPLSVSFAFLICLVTVGLDLLERQPMPTVLVDVLLVAVISGVGLWVRTVVVRQHRYLNVARDIAEAAQLAVLPSPPRRVGSLRSASRYQPAQVEAAIGGDFYAVQSTPFGVRAIIGDVRGKGLQAVSAVSVVVGAFREHADHEPSLHALAQHLDDALDKEGEQRGEVPAIEGFTTALLVQVAPDEESVTLLDRGHTAPYLLQAGEVRPLEPSVPDIPLSINLPEAARQAPPDTHAFPPGASLLLITDGVTEARDRRGVFYDPRDGLAGMVFDQPDALVDTVVEQVTEWTGGERQDDVAILVLMRSAAPTDEPGCRRGPNRPGTSDGKSPEGRGRAPRRAGDGPSVVGSRPAIRSS